MKKAPIGAFFIFTMHLVRFRANADYVPLGILEPSGFVCPQGCYSVFGLKPREIIFLENNSVFAQGLNNLFKIRNSLKSSRRVLRCGARCFIDEEFRAASCREN